MLATSAVRGIDWRAWAEPTARQGALLRSRPPCARLQ
jgi:hypothetical protein